MNLVAINSQVIINAELSEILTKFKSMRDLGYSLKQIREAFIKDELLALLMWYAEKAEYTEGVHQSDLFDEFEIV